MGVQVVPAASIVGRSAVNLLEKVRFIVNLTDPVFRGKYRGRQEHEDDMEAMLERARKAHVKSMIITGTSLSESRTAVRLAKETGFYTTIGCHPTRSSEFDKYKAGPAAYLDELDKLIAANLQGKGRVVAVGECGLDYDRLHFANEETQKKHFRTQLSLAKKYHLPLFLHVRNAYPDFVKILKEEGFDAEGGKAIGGRGGVVHSFTGTKEEAVELLAMGFHFSVNGCSMKTEEQLEAVKSIPPSRMMLETDAPWCSCTHTHASKQHIDTLPSQLREAFLPAGARGPERFEYGKPVKGRNEPMAIGAVAWVLSQIHGAPFERVAERTFINTVEVFQLSELR
ncbi:Mg-dependent DNase [Auriculariales sp. MPI-PUGE-AT-0066]|nr:Mg-dependent DNase [Auriculariales sp. MPI-PUGE-AT-0066]